MQLFLQLLLLRLILPLGACLAAESIRKNRASRWGRARGGGGSGRQLGDALVNLSFNDGIFSLELGDLRADFKAAQELRLHVGGADSSVFDSRTTGVETSLWRAVFDQAFLPPCLVEIGIELSPLREATAHIGAPLLCRAADAINAPDFEPIRVTARVARHGGVADLAQATSHRFATEKNEAQAEKANGNKYLSDRAVRHALNLTDSRANRPPRKPSWAWARRICGKATRWRRKRRVSPFSEREKFAKFSRKRQFAAMHIGLLHESDLPPRTYGGIERIVVALSRAYIRRGHTVTVICRNGDAEKIAEHPEDARAGRLKVHKLPPDYHYRPPKEWLPKLDFLHSHQPLVYNGSDEFRPPMPFLVTIHGNGSAQENYYRNTAFLSESHAANHSAKYFVYNGVDPTRYTFQSKKDDYFVFLARTTWRVKNVKTAIAWAQDLGVRLEIMGGSGVSRGKIHYNGLVDEPEKVKLLAGARALIYPTNWNEPCAGAPLEALACGTPVIATPNGCMPELVREGTGVICSNYDELLASAEKVKALRPEDCRNSVETFFSDERMTDDYLKLFEKVIAMGDLDHQPRWSEEPQKVELLYKPTVFNRLRLAMTGKI